METRVKVLENEKCCGNTGRRRVFPQLFRVKLKRSQFFCYLCSQEFEEAGEEFLYRKECCSSEVLKRAPVSYQDPFLWAWLEIFFIPKRYQF